jgi:hypothetical protein
MRAWSLHQQGPPFFIAEARPLPRVKAMDAKPIPYEFPNSNGEAAMNK